MLVATFIISGVGSIPTYI